MLPSMSAIASSLASRCPPEACFGPCGISLQSVRIRGFCYGVHDSCRHTPRAPTGPTPGLRPSALDGTQFCASVGSVLLRLQVAALHSYEFLLAQLARPLVY